ncbi:hypothetical protein Theam_1819 (plasmid) [Thermovibrio ammonificans HB-1]|uniref:Uncharacterized protein n=1 Tax=Thermovibrio ammonificans (strain DSM 15698 / JCM 12110 / HB-1) TaxID=648996 RepID=E8T6V2_THEA1|nr:hypothetical protein [Thermovibrio ammonificans]ADU97775.1 hypothetical protein Theam_1819 [Thermovibrio ammonificans HB-1]
MRAEIAVALLEAVAGMRPGGGPLKGLVFWLYVGIAHLLLVRVRD